MSYKDELQKEMREVVDQLGNVINNFSYDDQADAFFQMLTRQHRTLQQNFWRMIIKVILRYADTKWFDPRNEASVELCKKFKKLLEDEGWLDLPTV